MDTNSRINSERLHHSGTLVHQSPFCFLIAEHMLLDQDRAVFSQDFPQYSGAGFFPYEETDCGPNVRRLIEELIAPSLANTIGEKLGIPNLGQYPTLITICRFLNKRHGTIHTDSRSKIVTALLYLNDTWPDTSDGCLRFLNRENDIHDLVVPEIKPLYGTFVAFKRADNSFHGHLPYEGERRVIQIAWLISEEEKWRKTKRGKLSRLFKKIFGILDRRLGANRGDNAAHMD